MKTAVALTAMAGNALAVSPTGKVIELLAKLGNQVHEEIATETKAMEEYTNYCDDESTEKRHAIKVATSDIERFEAIVEESNGKIGELDSTIASSGSAISGKQGELAEATNLRSKENKDYKAAEKELVETVDMLARAASVLKRELSFAQNGSVSQKALKAKLGNMVEALNLIVASSRVDARSAQKVRAFLQDDDDLVLTQQPQAKTVAYESKSGGIVDTLKDMQDKAEDQLAGLRQDETRSRHAFEMLQQGLSDEVANLEKMVNESTSTKGSTQEVKAKAEEDSSRTSKALGADQSFLKNLQSECQLKAEEWEQRQKAAAEEQAALAKASDILSSGVKNAFVQVKAKTQRLSAVEKNEEVRSSLVSMLRRLSRSTKSFGLMQLASHAKSDPFVKIRGLIDGMVAKLEKEASEEATQEAFCQEEQAKSAKAKESKTASVEKYTTRLDKATAGVAQLNLEIGELTKQVSEIEKSNAAATGIRTEENEEYKKASSEQKQAVDAVARAIQVLQEFYGAGEAAALLQQPSFGGAKGDQGNNIISFLEVAQSDFSTLLAQTETDESESQKAFETLMQANKVSKATKEASVKGKNSEVQSLKVAIEDAQGDLKTSNTELDAVLDYVEKLRPQCESKAMTYAERKAARDAELQGLKTALDILSGEEAALSFMQKRKASVQTFLGF